MDMDALIVGMIDFVEENWFAFLDRMIERGYTEEEIEVVLQKALADRNKLR